MNTTGKVILLVTGVVVLSGLTYLVIDKIRNSKRNQIKINRID